MLTEARKPNHPDNREIAERLRIDVSRLSQEPFKSELAKLRRTLAEMGVAVAKGFYDDERIIAMDPDAKDARAAIDRRLDGDDD